jgi:RNA polymerase sigma-70 factor (TIGR02957 family)
METEVTDNIATAGLAGAEARRFEALRPYLFAIAYRLLGSASEAEDVVQDAYLRVHETPAVDVASPKAYLAAVVTRLCLDRLKSARTTRETYLGPWLPEPVPTADLEPSPAEVAERREEISLAFLVLLERLSPEERAAYVLHEAFDEPYDEIAAVLGKSVPATRQLAHRARARIADDRPRFSASPEEQRRLTERFLAAARDGDLRALTDVLAADVTLWADGGPKARAARRPIVGSDAVARWLVGIVAKAPVESRVDFAAINGGVAALHWVGGELTSATTIDVLDGRIQAIRAVVNPDKLAYLARRLAPPPAAAI